MGCVMLRWVWMLSLFALLSACNLVSSSEAEERASGEPTLVVPSGDARLTYSNPDMGYAFDYPGDWHLVVEDPTFVEIWSMNPAEIPTAEGSRYDAAQGDFVVMSFLAGADAANDSLDAVVERYKQVIADGGITILSEVPIQLPSGLEAVELKTDEGGILLLTVIDGRTVQIDGYGTPAYFYAVIDSLRAL